MGATDKRAGDRSVQLADIGRFRLNRKLGAGGMGDVYEATDLESASKVALKALQRITPDALMFFKNEFRSLADIQHPNLISLGELLEEDGLFFFTMELVRGTHFIEHVAPARKTTVNVEHTMTSMGDVSSDASISGNLPRPSNPGARTKAAFDEQRLRESLRQLAGALHALHRAKKIHRDVKPSNVMINHEGRVVVLDFGLVADSASMDRSGSHRVMGTVAYMAPEQTTSANVTPAADWYAVGSMLFQALTGRLPYEGAAAEISAAKRSFDAPSPSDLTVGLPDDLVALCQSLLQRDPADRPSGEEILRRLGVNEQRYDGHLAGESRFVGRRQELRQLAQALRAVREGKTQTVLVQGESGAGKSVLVKQFLDATTREDPNVLVLGGRCYEKESVPYKAVDELIDGLGRYLAELDDRTLAKILPDEAWILSSLFPVLKRIKRLEPRERDRARAIAAHEKRTLAFSVLREIFCRLASRRTLILAIDDIQWADQDSLQLLQAVMATPGQPVALLVTTMRTVTEVREGLLAPQALGSYLAGDVHTVMVGPLPEEDALALAEQLASGAETPVDLAQVLAEAGGHPLFIDALIHHRLTHSDAPSALRLDDALRWRVERLEPATRELLELCCVATTPVPLKVAAWATVNDASVLERQVGLLKSANLVRTMGLRGSETLEPFHDRVRQTVTDALEGEHLERWHGRLALAGESVGGLPEEVLATHWRMAGHHRRSADYLRACAEQSADALAFERAARLFRESLDLGSWSDKERSELRIRLGDVLVHDGRGNEAAAEYLDVAKTSAEPMATELKRQAAEQLLASGHLDRGFAVLAEVTRAAGMPLPESPKGALARLLYHRLKLKMRGHKYELRSEADIPVEILSQVDTAWSAASTLMLVDTVKGMLYQTRHLTLALKSGEPYRIARALAVEASYSSNPGAHMRDKTEAIVAEARTLAERTGREHAIAWAVAAEGGANYLFGKWKRGWEITQRGVQAMRRCPEGTAYEIDTLTVFGFSSLAQLGRFDELGKLLPQRLREADDRQDRYGAFNLRSGHLNATWLAQDDPQKARRLADEAGAHLSDRGFYVQHYYDLLAQCHIDLYEGQDEQSFVRVERAWDAFNGSLLPRVQHPRLFGHYIRARTALASARHVDARSREERVKIADKSANALAKESAAWAAGAASSIRAVVAHFRGNADKAQQLLRDATAHFDLEDMPVHAAVTRRRLAEIVASKAEAERLLEHGDNLMREHGIERPERFARLFLPELTEAR